MTRLKLTEDQARFVVEVLAGELEARPDDFITTVSTGDGFLAWSFCILGERRLVLGSELTLHWYKSHFDDAENERIRVAGARLINLRVELGLREAEVNAIAAPGTRVRPSGLAERLSV
jgi:hypothetical protein